jgi:hypothetical protein
LVNVRFGSTPCENSNARRARRNILEKFRIMRTDNAADIRLDAMLENYIFYISRMYEFSHSLGQKRTNHRGPKFIVVRFGPILLQKSQIAERQFFRQKTRQAVIAE